MFLVVLFSQRDGVDAWMERLGIRILFVQVLLSIFYTHAHLLTHTLVTDIYLYQYQQTPITNL
jgi:hypothetical protein